MVHPIRTRRPRSRQHRRGSTQAVARKTGTRKGRHPLESYRSPPCTAPGPRHWQRGDDPVALGALVTTREGSGGGEGAPSLFWLAPHGGGNRLAGGTVQVLTTRSPVGRALLGKRAGEECEVVVAGKTRTLAIVAIR